MPVALTEVIADFMDVRLNTHVDSTSESILLGTAELKPELSALSAGQHVLLIEYGSLRAEGHIALYRQGGVTYYYGVVDGPIQDIDG